MDKKAIIQKIKKCLRLGTSANEHESATALRQARALMDKYSIGESDIAMADIGETEAQIAQRRSPPNYLIVLAHAVAECMGCGYHLVGRIDRGGVNFIGVSPNDELAAYAFETLARQLQKARVEYTATALRRVRTRHSKVTRADIFCHGWASSVYHAGPISQGCCARDRRHVHEETHQRNAGRQKQRHYRRQIITVR